MVKTGTGNGSTPCYSLFSVVLTDPTDGLLIWNDLSTPAVISVSSPIRGTPRQWRPSGSCDG